MLDEQALRKPGFVEGARVVLGDGQEWSIPRPRLRLVPSRTPDGDIALKSLPKVAAHRQADMDAMLESGERSADGDENGFVDWLLARARLATGLLLDNYELDDAALAVLLPVEFGDDANADMWAEIDGVLRGRHAKPSAVG